MSADNSNDLRRIIKQQRLMAGLTLQQLSVISGVSASHLGRIERGERFPSASVIRKIAKPLGIEEVQLLISGGFLSPRSSTEVESPTGGQLDPYVARVLAQEPVDVQRAVIGILSILKTIAKGVIKEPEG